MQRVEKGTYVDAVVELDDHDFDDCTFTNCELIYKGGPLGLNRSRLIRCRWIFEGPALSTLSVLAALFQMNPAYTEDLVAHLRKGQVPAPRPKT
jgi:hypothetical protein